MMLFYLFLKVHIQDGPFYIPNIVITFRLCSIQRVKVCTSMLTYLSMLMAIFSIVFTMIPTANLYDYLSYIVAKVMQTYHCYCADVGTQDATLTSRSGAPSSDGSVRDRCWPTVA